MTHRVKKNFLYSPTIMVFKVATHRQSRVNNANVRDVWHQI